MIPPAAGLPAYTLPPTSGAAPSGFGPRPDQPGTAHPAAAPASDHAADQWAHRPSWDAPGASSGVGAPGASRQPFGGAAAQVSTPPTQFGTYGSGAPGQAGPVPHQRVEGTVYGGLGDQSPIDMTVPVTMNAAVENSGSLTGHILAQGWDAGHDSGHRSNVKVAIAMLVVLVFLVGMSLLFLATAGDAFTDMITGVFNQE